MLDLLQLDLRSSERRGLSGCMQLKRNGHRCVPRLQLTCFRPNCLFSGCRRLAAAVWGGAHVPSAACCATSCARCNASGRGGGGARAAAGSPQNSRQWGELVAGINGWHDMLLQLTDAQCQRMPVAALFRSCKAVRPCPPRSLPTCTADGDAHAPARHPGLGDS